MAPRTPHARSSFHRLLRLWSTALLLAVLLPAPAAGQQDVGSCEKGTASHALDANRVDARLYNTGTLFFKAYTAGAEAQYEVPKGSGRAPLYSQDLWLGGKVDDSLRTAAGRYLSEYWPGPLGEDALPSNPSDCSANDEIHGVMRGDLREYAQTGIAPEDLASWPHHLGAPVLDGDGVVGNYDLEAGDRPALLGDEMAWWVMNDAGNVHEESESLPLGMEVRVTAFAHARPAMKTLLDSTLAHATFYRYQLRYRGAAPLTDAYFGLYIDPDVGSATDDFVGTDTTRNMIFAYNAHEEDDVYGTPPALGYALLGAPEEVPDERPLTASLYYVGGGPSGTEDPTDAEMFYNNLRGFFSDGTPMTEGDLGYMTGGRETNYMFPGDPVEQQFWSEENRDGSGNRNQPGDHRMMLASGPFGMQSGETKTFEFAIVFAQGRDRLDSIVRLREAVDTLAAHAAELYTPDATVDVRNEPASELPETLRAHVYPNPARGQAHLQYAAPTGAPLRAEIYDVLGRQVDSFSIPTNAPGRHSVPIDVRGFGAGTYFVRLQQDVRRNQSQSAVSAFIVVR